MSPLTSFRLSDASARATSLGMPRHRVMAVAFGVLCLATVGAVGIALVSQAPPVTNQPVLPSETAVTASSAPAVTQAAVAPRLSPWRDAWYLEDQRLRVSDPPVATSEAPATVGTPRDVSMQTHDDLALSAPPAIQGAAHPADRHEEPARDARSPAVPLDLSVRAYDDWAVANSSPRLDLSPARHDDWPLDSGRQAP